MTRGKEISLDITPAAAGRRLISGYGDGGFVFGGLRHKGSVLIVSGRLLPWEATERSDINLATLSPLIEASERTDILLVGCGPTFTAAPAGLRRELKAHGVALEWMDSGAACRTYNVLLLEDRLVAAALIAVD